MTNDPKIGDRLIKLPEVAQRVGLGKTAIYEKINEGSFPAPYKLSQYASRWSEQEIERWIEYIKGVPPKSAVPWQRST